MTRSQSPPLRLLRRFVLWMLPFLAAVGLWLGHRIVEARAAIGSAELLLAEGNSQEAVELLTPWQQTPWIGAHARTGVVIAQAFADDGAAKLDDMERAELDAEAFDLPLIIRAAFERAEFGSVLRLTELSRGLGRPTVELVTLAAQIEAGAPTPVHVAPELLDFPQSGGHSLLAQRVAHHLSYQDDLGIAIRDRHGNPMGRLNAEGDAIDYGRGIRPEWIPPAVVDFAEQHADAGSVRTSLDLEISKAAYESFGRYRGSIVLVDPLTGEVLAAVSDRRTRRRNEGTPAFEQRREPASIAKLITTAAYIRGGHNPDLKFHGMACRGHEFYDGKPLYCPVIGGPLRNLDRAMAMSCNVAFANLAQEIGRSRVLEEFRRFGFDRDLGPFPGGRIIEPLGDTRQLADLSIGLEATDITPLHAALLAATVANHGVMPEPTLMHSKDGKLGLHPTLLPRGEDRRILDRRTVEVLRRSMEAVVNRGTAMRVRTRGFPVAMKTGTASDPRYGFHVNYIGFGPLPEARVAFCVRITHQGTSRRVRLAAAEVTGRLLRKLRTLSRKRGWQDPQRQDPTSQLVKLGDRLSAQQVADLPAGSRLRR